MRSATAGEEIPTCFEIFVFETRALDCSSVKIFK